MCSKPPFTSASGVRLPHADTTPPPRKSHRADPKQLPQEVVVWGGLSADPIRGMGNLLGVVLCGGAGGLGHPEQGPRTLLCKHHWSQDGELGDGGAGRRSPIPECSAERPGRAPWTWPGHQREFTEPEIPKKQTKTCGAPGTSVFQKNFTLLEKLQPSKG